MRAGDSQHLKVDLEINEDDKVNLESRLEHQILIKI